MCINDSRRTQESTASLTKRWSVGWWDEFQREQSTGGRTGRQRGAGGMCGTGAGRGRTPSSNVRVGDPSRRGWRQDKGQGADASQLGHVGLRWEERWENRHSRLVIHASLPEMSVSSAKVLCRGSGDEQRCTAWWGDQGVRWITLKWGRGHKGSLCEFWPGQ